MPKVSKMSNRHRSFIWNFFFVMEEEKDYAKCNSCGQKIYCKSSTSNMKRHMQRRHPTIQLNPNPDSLKTEVQQIEADHSYILQDSDIINEMLIIPKTNNATIATTLATTSIPSASTRKSSSKSSSSVRGKTIKSKPPSTTSVASRKKVPINLQKKIDDELLKLFTLDYQPFRMVEDDGFRRFVKILNPTYILPNKQTISTSLIPSLYERCLRNCREEAKNVTHCCLTTDCWTSVNNESFIGVTIHYLNSNFEMKSMFLKCIPFSENHASENLAEELRKTAVEWNLMGKIQLVVTNNASNIVKAVSNLLKWKHFGCYAHTLNLIVGDCLDLEEVKTVITKVRQIASHFKSSSSANAKLILHQKSFGIDVPKKIIRDVVTRWNSTYYMLERFVELEEILIMTLADLDTNLPQLSVDEWNLMKDLVNVLRPFENVTTAMSGEKYMSGSLLIVFTGSLKKIYTDLIMKEKKLTQSESLQKVISKLKEGLDSRLKNLERNDIFATCTLLDPRFKIYPFQDKSAAETIKRSVINRISEKILEENPTPGTSRNTVSDEQAFSKLGHELNIWSSIDEIIFNFEVPGTSSSRASVEMQRYLEDGILNRHHDPLQWWRENACLYPHLSIIVRETCCVLGTSVPCKSLFSKAGQILKDRRTRLHSGKLEQLIFLHYNDEHS